MLDKYTDPEGICPSCGKNEQATHMESKDRGSTQFNLWLCDDDAEGGCGYKWIETYRFKQWEPTDLEEFPDEEEDD